jgi:hypothetical protein
MAQGVRHGHQLGLVAELGEEHDTQTDQSGGEHHETFRRFARCATHSHIRAFVEGLAHRFARFAGRA